jgi:hypothetical protein
MKAGSLLECIEDFPAWAIRVVAGYNGLIPKRGAYYVCAGVRPCGCGKHDRVELEETPGVDWDARNFREVQPPTSVDELLKEREPVITFDFNSEPPQTVKTFYK